MMRVAGSKVGIKCLFNSSLKLGGLESCQPAPERANTSLTGTRTAFPNNCRSSGRVFIGTVWTGGLVKSQCEPAKAESKCFIRQPGRKGSAPGVVLLLGPLVHMDHVSSLITPCLSRSSGVGRHEELAGERRYGLCSE